MNTSIHDQRRAGRFCVCLTILIGLFLFVTTVFAGNLRVSYTPSDDLLSIDASDVPLKKLMSEIAEKSGLEITVAEKADQPVSITIANQSLEDALKNLARTYRLNHMFIHHTRNGQTLLKEMKILPATSPSLSPDGRGH